MKVGSEYYFYHNDHLGTPQKLTTISGAVVWSAKYSSFGKAQVDAASTVVNNLRFPGQYYDQETKLHYNNNRYYDSISGRYINFDLIGLEGGINAFLYAEENPQTFMDPQGLFVEHNWLTADAFKNQQCDNLKSDAVFAANNVDNLPGSNDPKNAHWHAMRNGPANETVESAKMKTEERITEQLGRCNAEGLGYALHAEQYKFAAGHRGYQPWFGGIKQTPGHLLVDITGGGKGEALKASINLIQRFKKMCPKACCPNWKPPPNIDVRV